MVTDRVQNAYNPKVRTEYDTDYLVVNGNSFPTGIAPSGTVLTALSETGMLSWETPTPQGDTGLQGVTGKEGVTGAYGGPQGDTGLSGVTGAFGGPPGQTGVSGVTGLQGATGLIGVTGLQNATGIQGQTGAQAHTGAQGHTGAPGVTGFQGATGLQNATGIQGQTGAQGHTGAPGVTGFRGVTGLQNATGIQGQTGAQGHTGAQGYTGAKGTTGLQGDSSYITINSQTDSYTLVGTDAGKIIDVSKSTACTLTIPKNSSVDFATGTTIAVRQGGAGQLTIAPVDGTVTINNPDGLKLAARYAVAVLIKFATDTWTLYGECSS